jgi:GT2 family glycosyltransferase
MTKPIAPFVTVVIPTLNEAQRIEACLESVMAQDYPHDRFEVIIADGLSRDGTQERAAAFSERYPQVRLVANPKQIQAAAFNLGVKEGKGEIIIRMDAHALYSNEYIRRCVEVLGETGAANVGGLCQTQPGADTLIAHSVALMCMLWFGAGAARARRGGKAGPVDSVPFGAFRRETFARAGLMDERLVRGEDNEFNARIRQKGMTVHFDPRIRLTYFTRPTVRAFLKQMFQNGLYHVQTLMVNRGGCSLRHFVPFGFVMLLVACAVAGFIWSPAWYVGAGVLGLYLVANVVASVHAAARHGWRYLVVLPWLFFVTHVCYGIGTLLGIFKFGFTASRGASGESRPPTEQ